jgi:hypothetical protein
VENVIKYSTLLLTVSKYRENVLKQYIYTLVKHGTTTDEVVSLLEKLYDFSNPKELLTVARAAKDCGAIDVARRIMELAGELLGK